MKITASQARQLTENATTITPDDQIAAAIRSAAESGKNFIKVEPDDLDEDLVMQLWTSGFAVTRIVPAHGDPRGSDIEISW